MERLFGNFDTPAQPVSKANANPVANPVAKNPNPKPLVEPAPISSLLGGDLEPYCGRDADTDQKTRSNRCKWTVIAVLVATLLVSAFVGFAIYRTVTPPSPSSPGGDFVAPASQ